MTSKNVIKLLKNCRLLIYKRLTLCLQIFVTCGSGCVSRSQSNIHPPCHLYSKNTNLILPLPSSFLMIVFLLHIQNSASSRFCYHTDRDTPPHWSCGRSPNDFWPLIHQITHFAPSFSISVSNSGCLKPIYFVSAHNKWPLYELLCITLTVCACVWENESERERTLPVISSLQSSILNIKCCSSL